MYTFWKTLGLKQLNIISKLLFLDIKCIFTNAGEIRWELPTNSQIKPRVFTFSLKKQKQQQPAASSQQLLVDTADPFPIPKSPITPAAINLFHYFFLFSPSLSLTKLLTLLKLSLLAKPQLHSSSHWPIKHSSWESNRVWNVW